MTVENTPPGRGAAVPRTVQEYIDETPMWADSTVVRYSPMTNMQWLIWGLAAAGKFFEGMVVFMTGVALPLMGREFALGATEKGVVAAASLFGILIGATALGGLADRYGRKEMFIIEMVLFAIFILVLTFSASFLVVVCPRRHRPCAGLRLSDRASDDLREYSQPHSRAHGACGFGFQAVGGLAGTAIDFDPVRKSRVGAWRWMYATAIMPAVLVMIGRFFVIESALMARLSRAGRGGRGERRARLLRREPPYPNQVSPARSGRRRNRPRTGARACAVAALFAGVHLRRTILASVPWFLQDLGTYGIGIFTPTILATVIGASIEHPRNTAELIRSDILAAKGRP